MDWWCFHNNNAYMYDVCSYYGIYTWMKLIMNVLRNLYMYVDGGCRSNRNIDESSIVVIVTRESKVTRRGKQKTTPRKNNRKLFDVCILVNNAIKNLERFRHSSAYPYYVTMVVHCSLIHRYDPVSLLPPPLLVVLSHHRSQQYYY